MANWTAQCSLKDSSLLGALPVGKRFLVGTARRIRAQREAKASLVRRRYPTSSLPSIRMILLSGV